MSDTPTDILKNASGWDILDLEGEALNEINRENQAECDEWAQRIHRVFTGHSTPEDGRAVLDRLIRITLLRSTVTPNASQFEAGIREGRADLVREILAQIEYAQSL